MAFDSLTYIVFLASVVLLYARLGRTERLLLLVLASLTFYAAWSIPLVSLILISAAVDFKVAAYLGRPDSTDARRRRRALALSVVVNLGLLGFFKYSNFFLENVHAVLGTESTPVLDIILPPGISFYTFQTMSYTIDVYRGHTRPTRSFLRFLLFVSFFPQLIAGPIERAGRLLTQFDHAVSRRLRLENFVVGVQLIAWGLFKKMVIADHCGTIADAGFSDAGFDGWSGLIATYAFTLQIYCDFSAYSEIARGSARIFGIDLMRNFDQPYLTTNIRDFWRRWHISLSNWFRDYVYLPLGGSRRGRRRTLINLGITMFLSGLWHGAAWNFVAWGLLHGALLVLHAVTAQRIGARTTGPIARRVTPWLFWFGTFHAVVWGWLLFRANSFAQAGTMTATIAEAVTTSLPSATQALFVVGTFAFVATTWLERRVRLLDRIHASPTLAAPFTAGVIVLTVLLGAENGAAFIYFQF